MTTNENHPNMTAKEIDQSVCIKQLEITINRIRTERDNYKQALEKKKEIKEEYKKKYVELILTGEIPVNPYFMYEYKVPVDLDVPMHIIGYTKEDEIIVDFDLYLNKKNELVFACNQTPAILCYKPKLTDYNFNKETLTEFKI